MAQRGRPKKMQMIKEDIQKPTKEIRYELIPLMNEKYICLPNRWRVSPGYEQEFRELLISAGFIPVKFGGYQ